MKLLFDFFPILLFFLAFKVFGIYTATAVTMAASLLQVSVYWLKNRRFESLHLITLAIVILLGGSTLWLHNDLFIKWKPTVIYWIFALFFLGSQFIGKKPLVQRLLGAQLSLPHLVWRRLNFSWIIFFSLMGMLNVYVLYHFSTNAWVNFKLFGSLGLTLAFLVVQAIYMSRFMEQKNMTTSMPINPPVIPKDNARNDF